MRTLRDIPVLQNIPVLVRAALNVPIENGSVVSDYRLRCALPTLRYLTERGARVVLISHLGDLGTETLAPVARALGTLISNVTFSDTTTGATARDRVRQLPAGHILVLENLRRDKREKGNDLSFAHELAELADLFVEDCFDTCHRKHASIVTLPTLLPSYAGLLLEEEVRELSSALNPKSASLAVIGGAKFTTKEAVLNKLLSVYDHVFVGGALANDFLKASGLEVGKSLISDREDPEIVQMLKNPKLLVPIDSIVLPASALGSMNALSCARVAKNGEVRADEIILDHGPATRALLADVVKKAKTVLWSGPLGKYEDGFVETTDALARAVAASKAHSVLGGGDTIAAIAELGLLPHFSFVSSGGGAMLDFLAYGTLPGIAVLG